MTPPKGARTRPPTRKHRTVGQPPAPAGNTGDPAVEVAPDDPDAGAGEAGWEPFSVEEAERVLARIHGTKDARELTADRAEAMAQIQVAEATLAALAVPALPVRTAPERTAPDPERLRRVARLAVTASVNLRQAEAALERLPHDLAAGAAMPTLAAIETAREEAERAREEMNPARRRTVGALISASGMVIVIATVGWPAWAYLVPTQLVLLVTADLRVAGAQTRKMRGLLAERVSAGGIDVDHLDEAKDALNTRSGAQARRDDAARRHAEAWAAWEGIAPGADPGAVEALIDRAGPTPSLPSPAPTPDDPATERARLMAETLIEEAVRELAMIAEAEAELALRLRAERSLAWHATAGTPGALPA